jgi:DNA-directed RNA polymerase subunit E'/Rpb7
MASIESPYVDTNISLNVTLSSSELNNDILQNIKNKVKEYENKCYIGKDQNLDRTYEGFISKIYSVNSYSHGIINAEDLNCNGIFNVSFYCKLCCPQLNTLIVGKILRMDANMISCESGPIIVIIQTNKINPNLKDQLPEIGEYVKIRILQKRFLNGDKHIKVLGYLEDKASEEEAKNNLF